MPARNCWTMSSSANVEQSMRDIIEDLGTRPAVPSKAAVEKADAAADEEAPPPPALAPDCRVYCLPARADRDELAGAMLVQLLRQQGFGAQNAPAKLVAGELLALVEKADVDVVCISVVAPSTVIHARYLCLKLRALLPKQKIVIGLWGATEDVTEAARRLRDSGADEVVTTLAEALVQIAKLAPPLIEEMTPAPIPADEEERLAALAELNLLDTEAEPVFDRITAKLARVFEVPIALISLIDRDRQFFKSQTGLPEDLAKARQTARNVSVCGHVVAKNAGDGHRRPRARPAFCEQPAAQGTRHSLLRRRPAPRTQWPADRLALPDGHEAAPAHRARKTSAPGIRQRSHGRDRQTRAAIQSASRWLNAQSDSRNERHFSRCVGTVKLNVAPAP